MTNTRNEIAKLLSLIGSAGFGGLGLTAVFGGLGLAPIAAGGVALAAGFAAGASALNFSARDVIGLLRDEKEELNAELELAKNKLKLIEQQLRDELQSVTAERDRYKAELERTVTQLMADCHKLQTDIKYWEEGKNPRILESPPVKLLIETLTGKLDKKLAELRIALEDVLELEQENKDLLERIAELEAANESLDGELATVLFEFGQLKTNFNYRLELEVRQKLDPYCNKAVAVALEKKLAEIANLKQAITMLQEDLAGSQAIVNAIESQTLPDIQTTYNQQMSARDSKLLQLAGQNDLLMQKIAELEAPRKFPGKTYPDEIGNTIIDHFHQYEVTFDAHSTETIPGGFRVRFRVDRNQEQTKLSEEEFNKTVNQCGLMGLSMQPLSFKLDRQNFLISVDIFSGAFTSPGLQPDTNRTPTGHDNGDLSTINGRLTKLKSAKTKAGRGSQQALLTKLVPDTHRDRFIELGCFAADQFGEVIREKFVNRVRVCAGSTGGKSPLMELIAVWLAKLNRGILTLINPIPGSPKDWFRVPGIIQQGMDAESEIKRAVASFHDEFKRRRNNLEEATKKDYMILALDEDNATARDYEELGKFFKDAYQLFDHANLGFISAGQGLNVSGLSGGTTRKKPKEGEEAEKNVGNAVRLMEEDFQNCTLVLTSDQASAWINKKMKGTGNKAELLDKLQKLNDLCDELNDLEGLTARPKVGDAKKVSPNAYRIALVVSPAHAPFFMQIPAYSSFDLEGVRFPEGARVTSTHWRDAEEVADGDRLAEAFTICPECGGGSATPQKPYADGSLKYRCNARECRKLFKVMPE